MKLFSYFTRAVYFAGGIVGVLVVLFFYLWYR
jgi:hypothetical protein